MNGIVTEILKRGLADTGDLFFWRYRTGEKLKSIKNGIPFACIRAGSRSLYAGVSASLLDWLYELAYDDSTVARATESFRSSFR